MAISSLNQFFYLLTLCSILLFSSMDATEYQPWLGNFYEFELRSDIKYSHYPKISSGSHLKKIHSDDVFLNLSLSNALPDPAYGLEFEITEACTKKQPGEIDQLKLTGKFSWLDDIAGDPYSLITGLSYIQAFSGSLKDVSSFHHGLYNAEFFISLGKEISEESWWESRWWGLFAIGVAEQGSPWLRLQLDYGKKWLDKHEVGLFIHTLWGLGGDNLYTKHFKGYGSVGHQSIDLGLRYTYLIEYFGSADIQYAYRVYSRNFPAYSQQLLIRILYTFGI